MSYSPFFQSIYRLKRLYRQGWIGKVPVSEIESVADHSFAVANLALVLVPIENFLRKNQKENFRELNKHVILEKSLVHDLPESQYLDLDRTIPNLIGNDTFHDFKNEVDEAGEKKIQTQFEDFAKEVFSIELRNILPKMNAKESEEDEFVKVLDILELLLQATDYFQKKFISQENVESFIKGTKEKLGEYSDKFLFLPYLLK